MKNLTRIFVAVVALFTSIACTTDTTEDLGVNGLGQTTLTLSLEASRTQLGEKVGDLYPVYWSEGDQISVNGVASNALTAEQAGSSVAAFTVNGTHTTFNIAYPAAEANQVLFAANQVHTSNTTFASGAATLYGVGSTEEGIELRHLTGVLKIGVVGTATLKKAQISTIDNAPIAGAFDIDFTNGEVEPSATAVSTINYSFGEGVALSSEPTYIHVAVPAGVYDELYVTLFDNNNGVMYATVKANDTKPLTAGNVRTFSKDIEFAPINSVAHIISEAADLVAFASEAATSTKDVVFVNDIDMSEVEWTPIEGYAGTINGNGYAIKGLKAPLFGATNAKIKGLHLKNINQEWTTLTHGGLFACDLSDGGQLSHCSTEGKIVINNTTYAEPVVRQQYDFVYGGLVGLTTGATIEHCENKADIIITSVCSQSVAGSNYYGCSLGGVVGAADLIEGGAPTSITHAVNRGEILINNTLPLSRGYYWMGGVFGQTIAENSLSAFSHCYNYGDISTIKDCPLAVLRLGGLFGDLATNEISTCDFLENHGDIFIHGELATNSIQVYGIGYTAYIKDGVNDCLNTGNINVQCNGLANTYICGGILGITASSETKGICHRMKNKGNITFAPYKESSITGTLTIVGLTNNMNCGLEGTEDNLSGNSGNINITSTSTASLNVAGVAVNVGEGFSFKNVENSGAITVNSNVTAAKGDIYISGISTTNKANSSFTNIKNRGNITVTGSAYRHAVVNGIGNEMRCTMNNVVNSGNIETSLTTGNNMLIFGGARLVYLKATDFHNTGNVTVSGTATAGMVQVAGTFDTLGNHAATTDASKPSSNSGTITCTAKALSKDQTVRVAGYAAVLNYNKGVSNILNTGDVICEAVAENAAPIYVGGLTCNVNYPLSNGENRGNVSFSGVGTNTVYLTGIGMTMAADASLTDVTNSGKISSTGSHKAQVRLGGIIGLEYASAELIRAVNTGDIEMNGEVTKSIGVGGIWPINQKAEVKCVDCHNSGAITVISTTENTSSNNIAGLVGYTAKNMTFDGCSNSGKVVDGVKKGIYVDQAVNHGYFDVAGGVGYVYRSKITILNGFTNSADIHVKVDKRMKSSYPIGGVLAIYNYNTTTNYEGWTGKIVNTGDITYEGEVLETEQLGVGGIVGVSGANACSAELINTGKITAIKGKNGMPATYGFGGIFGIAGAAIENAQSYFTIDNDDLTNFGWITGSARANDSVVATNCKIGGGFTAFDDADESMKVVPFTDSDFYNYIYGNGVSTDWAGTDNYDGCTLLSEKPAI